MSIIGLQIILIGFAFFMIYILFIHWKKKDIGNITLWVWLMIWLIFVVLTMFPKVLEGGLLKSFFVRAMDFGMIIAFMILTYLTIENNIYHKKTEEKVEKIVRYLVKKEGSIKL